MLNPKRPTTITTEMKRHVAKDFVEKYRYCLPGCIDDDELVSHLEKHIEMNQNGYQSAKTLECWEGWDIEADTVTALEDFNSFMKEALNKAEFEWVEKNNIQPPFPENTEVEYMHGLGLKKGVITGIYPYRAGRYEIRENGHNDEKDGKRRAIVKWEDVKEVV